MLHHTNISTQQLVKECIVIILLVVSIAFGLRFIDKHFNIHTSLDRLAHVLAIPANAQGIEYSSTLIEQSHKEINILPEKDITVTALYKNKDTTNRRSGMRIAPTEPSYEYT